MLVRVSARRLSHISTPRSRLLTTVNQAREPKIRKPVTQADPSRLKKHYTDIFVRYNPDSLKVLPAEVREKVNRQITYLNNAIAANNAYALIPVLEVSRKWNVLQHVDDRVLLKAVQLVQRVTLTSGEEPPWDPKLHDLLVDITTYAASRDADGIMSEGLISYMLLMLKRRDFQAVLDAYQRYLIVFDDSLPGEGETTSAGEAPTNPPRIQILLAAVSACALRGSFKEALDICLSSPHRFHSATTASFIHKLGFDARLRTRMGSWTQYLNVARLVARPGAFSRTCANLGNTGADTQLEHLYTSLLSGIEGPNAYIAATAAQVTKQKAVAMTEGGWSALLHAFVSCNRKDLADKLWEDLGRLEIPHTVALWTTRIEGCVKDNDFAKAGLVWKTMRNTGIQPDGVAYRVIISAMLQGRRVGEADTLFNEFKQQAMSKSSPEDTLAIYNSMIHGLLPAHRDAALALLSKMEASNTTDPRPDVVSYNTVLAFFRHHRDLRGLASTITRMTSTKVTGDVQTFSTILSALVDSGREDAGEMVLSLMQKQGVQANTHTYTSIIKLQMQGNIESIQAGMQLLQQMEDREDMPDPSDVTYTTVLSGLARTDALDHRTVEENMKAVSRRMTKRGFKLDARGYTIMINAYLSNTKPDSVQRALSYYKDMRDAKVPIPMSTWFLLLKGLVGKGESQYATKIVADLRGLGITPDRALEELIRQIR